MTNKQINKINVPRVTDNFIKHITQLENEGKRFGVVCVSLDKDMELDQFYQTFNGVSISDVMAGLYSASIKRFEEEEGVGTVSKIDLFATLTEAAFKKLSK